MKKKSLKRYRVAQSRRVGEGWGVGWRSKMIPCTNTPTFLEKRRTESFEQHHERVWLLSLDIITILTIHPKLQPIPKRCAYNS